MMKENPYAPPVTSAPPPDTVIENRGPASFDQLELDEARRRLKAHCADPAALAEDRAAEGMLLRPVTIVMLLLSALSGGAALVGILQRSVVLKWSGLIVGVLLFFVSLALVILDLRVGRRRSATDPVGALRRWFRAAKTGHAGYLFAGLAPTAREGTVDAPQLDPRVMVETHQKDSPRSLKAYLKSWARSNKRYVHWFQVKKVELVDQPAPDLARVRVRLDLAAWPQWANILSVVLFLLVRLIGLIVAVVLYYALRKTRTLEAEKLLMRGDDGLWYLLDADLRR
ncbi:MAG: hypothetical protein CSA65_08250 [Proteobacteria bacterium]|nr:MAG: hypothetical protein CSA65_08250 [Pseudomonadota bacterium]